MTAVTIRPAAPADAALIDRFVRELATYEALLHEVSSTPAILAEALFGPAPKAFCDIAEREGAPVGFALWFYHFSTFAGRHGLYLEDLYVREAARGLGVGKALLGHLARRCVDEGLARLQWSVLDWNRPAIDFYTAQGAVLLHDWTTCRVDGDALRRLAGDPAPLV